MDNILIREYSNEYQEQVIDLILNIQRGEFKIDITKDDQPDLSDIPDFYQKGGNFWVALHKKQVVGTIALINIGNQQGALRKMFVKAEYRGKDYGIAKQLLLKLRTWAKDRNMREIYLGTTEKFLAAHRFYEKNEFVAIAKEQLPAAFPIMKVDTRFYKHNLENAV